MTKTPKSQSVVLLGFYLLLTLYPSQLTENIFKKSVFVILQAPKETASFEFGNTVN